MENPIIKNVGQIAVPVKDMERAIDFYQNTLGLDMLFSTGNLSFFNCGELRILLSLPEIEEFSKASSVIYFTVDDIRDAFEAYKENNVQFTDEPHIVGKIGDVESWMVFFKDTEDNVLALMSEVEQ